MLNTWFDHLIKNISSFELCGVEKRITVLMLPLVDLKGHYSFAGEQTPLPETKDTNSRKETLADFGYTKRYSMLNTRFDHRIKNIGSLELFRVEKRITVLAKSNVTSSRFEESLFFCSEANITS